MFDAVNTFVNGTPPKDLLVGTRLMEPLVVIPETVNADNSPKLPICMYRESAAAIVNGDSSVRKSLGLKTLLNWMYGNEDI